ncbi:hypothetical protein ABPG74_014399 [Tetrahymena malaccensis]
MGQCHCSEAKFEKQNNNTNDGNSKKLNNYTSDVEDFLGNERTFYSFDKSKKSACDFKIVKVNKQINSYKQIIYIKSHELISIRKLINYNILLDFLSISYQNILIKLYRKLDRATLVLFTTFIVKLTKKTMQ